MKSKIYLMLVVTLTTLGCFGESLETAFWLLLIILGAYELMDFICELVVGIYKGVMSWVK